MSRIAHATIDLRALQHNFRRVKDYALQSRVICSIKANAYGHGLLEVAKALSDADGFWVACLSEALMLRQAGIDKPITVAHGYLEPSQLSDFSRYQLTAVIHHEQQLVWLQQDSQKQSVWIKVDTGMHRLGFAMSSFQSVYATLQSLSHIDITGVITHMASSDMGYAGSQTATYEQLSRFNTLLNNVPIAASAANSATLIQWPDSHYDWVRPGIMLYGVSPFSANTDVAAGLNLRPVMHFQSRLIAINHCLKGEYVGYGGIWQAPTDSLIGVVAAGYGDGYPRSARQGTPLLLNGQRVPLIGRVSMDMITVDLTAYAQHHSAHIGDNVTLWGQGVKVEEVANYSDTIANELLCGPYGRVTYRYL